MPSKPAESLMFHPVETKDEGLSLNKKWYFWWKYRYPLVSCVDGRIQVTLGVSRPQWSKTSTLDYGYIDGTRNLPPKCPQLSWEFGLYRLVNDCRNMFKCAISWSFSYPRMWISPTHLHQTWMNQGFLIDSFASWAMQPWKRHLMVLIPGFGRVDSCVDFRD